MSCKSRDVENPWGRIAAAAAASASSAGTADGTTETRTTTTTSTDDDDVAGLGLASIMAQQEEERRILDRIREMELREEREKKERREAGVGNVGVEGESEEDRRIRLAIEASLRDQREDQRGGETADDSVQVETTDEDTPDSTTECTAAAAATAVAAAAAAVSESSAAAAAAAASPPAAANNLSAEEMEQIERALKEGDEAERAASEAEAASLELAMRLQREEEEGERRRRAVDELGGNTTSNSSSHVRVVHGDDFHALKRGGEDDDRVAEDEDDVVKDYTQYVNYYDDDDYYDDPDDAALCSGYRINPQTPDGKRNHWTRTGRSGGDAVTNRSGTDVRTKHDVRLKNLSNAQRLAVPSSGGGGGGGGVSDNAYNSFHNRMRQRHGARKGVATHGTGGAENPTRTRTRGGALDGTVRLQVQRAINMNILTKMNGAVREGKEAVVYHADGGSYDDDGEGNGNKHDVAVKVFKRITEFRQRGEYVDGDPRFSRGRQKFSTLGKRERVELWTEKEYRNLVRAHESGVPTPRPLYQKSNVMFMRFLGEDGWPAPQLRDVVVEGGIRMGSPRWTNLYCQVLVAVRRLYHCAGLVHGDLSEFNILLCPSRQVFGGGGGKGGGGGDVDVNADAEADVEDGDELRVVLIDFGQAVHRAHPSSDELLGRDVDRVNAFFRGRGIRVLSDVDAKAFVLEAPRRRSDGGTGGGDGEAEDDADRPDTAVGAGAPGDEEADAPAALLSSEDAEGFVFVEKESTDTATISPVKESSAGDDVGDSNVDSKASVAADAIEPMMEESAAPTIGEEDAPARSTDASSMDTPPKAATAAGSSGGVEGMSGAKWRRAAIGWDEEGDHDRLQELLKTK